MKTQIILNISKSLITKNIEYQIVSLSQLPRIFHVFDFANNI
jgi:hypothetical protein